MLVFVLTIAASHPDIIRRHLPIPEQALGPVGTVLLLRPAAAILLISGAFYLICFAQTMKPRPVKSV